MCVWWGAAGLSLTLPNLTNHSLQTARLLRSLSCECVCVSLKQSIGLNGSLSLCESD